MTGLQACTEGILRGPHPFVLFTSRLRPGSSVEHHCPLAPQEGCLCLSRAVSCWWLLKHDRVLACATFDQFRGKNSGAANRMASRGLPTTSAALPEPDAPVPNENAVCPCNVQHVGHKSKQGYPSCMSCKGQQLNLRGHLWSHVDLTVFHLLTFRIPISKVPSVDVASGTHCFLQPTATCQPIKSVQHPQHGINDDRLPSAQVTFFFVGGHCRIGLDLLPRVALAASALVYLFRTFESALQIVHLRKAVSWIICLI